MNASMSRAILVVDDHELVRVGLKSFVGSIAPGSHDVLEAYSLRSAITTYEAHEPRVDLTLLDLNLPDTKGLLALQLFKGRFPQARVCVLSGSSDASLADEVRALGAEQFLHKSGDTGVLRDLLRDSGTGEEPSRPAPLAPYPTATRNRLSAREIQILDLVLRGRSNQEIVEECGLRIGTVKNYISGLLATFGVASRAKLISLFR
jgi:DNA-binding NarL/FixJ family response regulator